MSTPLWARGLLRLHPAEFRERWGPELEATLVTVLARARRGGPLRGLRASLRGAGDLAVSAVRARMGSGRTPEPYGGGRGDGFLRDVLHAFRSLRRQPLFTLSAVATLAVGIGASTVVFSLVYGFLFRPLPYADADELVMVWSTNTTRGWTRSDVSVPDARDWEARTGVFEGLSIIDRPTVTLTGDGPPERVSAHRATVEILDVMGVTPRLGRGFTPEDGRPGAPDVVLLSDGFWQRRFGGDPAIVGRTTLLDGRPFTVIGVMGPEFRFLDAYPEILLPLQEDLATERRENHSHMALARLADGVSVAAANRAVVDAAGALAEEYPETNENWSAGVVRLRDDALQAEGKAAVTVLSGAILFVLLMVCVNVANLMLARGRARRREMAVRTALGAGRGRLVRQVLTESGLLAFTGGALGFAASFAGVRAIVAHLPPEMSPFFRFAVDLPVLLFTLAIAVVATLASGLVPALRDSRASSAALREEGRSGEGRQGRRFGSALVVTQMALAVVLLVGGGTLMRSVSHMHDLDTGWDARGVFTFRLSPATSDYERDAVLPLMARLEEEIASIPGVESVGAIHSLPLRGSNNVASYALPGASGDDRYPARLNWVTPGYLPTMDIRVLAGRGIEASDREGGPLVVLANEALARRSLGGVEEAVGRTVLADDTAWTVVGVVENTLDRAMHRAPEPTLYLSANQDLVRTRSWVVRTSGDPAAIAPAVRRAIAAVDPDLPPYEMRPLRSLVADRIAPFSLVAGLMAGFAAISLILSAVGLYGVTAYGVGRRTHEIGLRLAVGAERGGVVRMLVGEGMRRAALGVLIGVLLAIPLSRALRAITVGIDPSDPLTFAAVVATLLAVAFLGTWLPARRAARLDPLRALSAE